MIKHFGARTSFEIQEKLMSNFKGLALSFAIITFLMVGVPILGAAIAYPDNCEQSVLIPCIGLE